MSKKSKSNTNPRVHKELEGYKVEINEFGQIISSFNVEKLNDFLNKEVDDKKLVDREDLEFIKDKKGNKNTAKDK